MSKLGDSDDFNFSQEEIDNLNKLLKLVKLRLASASKTAQKDAVGNTVYVDCDIYSNDTLVGFLVLSLSEFNQTPAFTDFTYKDNRFVDVFADALVDGVVLRCLAIQALIEKGREFKVLDSMDGVDFEPPNLSELLNTQYGMMLSAHFEKVRYIKENIHTFNK